MITPEEQELLERAVEEAHSESTEESTSPIPTNPPTIQVDTTTARFSSAVWYENVKSKSIIIAGVGGIGSYLTYLLARMKPSAMYIYDDDIVETVNMSGQLYSTEDVGDCKVDAISRMVKKYADYHSCFAITNRYTNESEASRIMMCGFDNMMSRRLFFNKWKRFVDSLSPEERKTCLFLDGRLDAEMFQVFCIKGDDTYSMHIYEQEYLFSDYYADESVCSYKQTTFCANMIASCMANLFVNFCANEVGAYRELPFKTTYSAETMFLKTEG